MPELRRFLHNMAMSESPTINGASLLGAFGSRRFDRGFQLGKRFDSVSHYLWSVGARDARLAP